MSVAKIVIHLNTQDDRDMISTQYRGITKSEMLEEESMRSNMQGEVKMTMNLQEEEVTEARTIILGEINTETALEQKQIPSENIEAKISSEPNIDENFSLEHNPFANKIELESDSPRDGINILKNLEAMSTQGTSSTLNYQEEAIQEIITNSPSFNEESSPKASSPPQPVPEALVDDHNNQTVQETQELEKLDSNISDNEESELLQSDKKEMQKREGTSNRMIIGSSGLGAKVGNALSRIDEYDNAIDFAKDVGKETVVQTALGTATRAALRKANLPPVVGSVIPTLMDSSMTASEKTVTIAQDVGVAIVSKGSLAVGGAVTAICDTVKIIANDTLTEGQKYKEVGKTLLKSTSQTVGAVLGSAIIPVPFLGAFVGGLVGGLAGGPY